MKGLRSPVQAEARRWGAKYGIPYLDDNYTNAYQHCYLACQATKKCGFPCAKDVTDLHERSGCLPFLGTVGGAYDVPTTKYNKDEQDRRHCMDLYNNQYLRQKLGLSIKK